MASVQNDGFLVCRVISRVYGGISIFVSLVVIWHAYCFTKTLGIGYRSMALKVYFDELKGTNYSDESVRALWGEKARGWTETLLTQRGSYWKAKDRSLLSIAIVDGFLGYNKLAFDAARAALALRPGSINTMDFLADFYRRLEMFDRERACREAQKMVLASSMSEDVWLALERCRGL